MPVTPRRTKRRRVATRSPDDFAAEENIYGKFRHDTSHQNQATPRCYGCHIDLGQDPYILCAECDSVHLCFNCFSVGAYLPPHRWQHPYRIMTSCAQPLFAEEWSAAEEIKFVDALFKYGIHQWALVARAVATKSKIKCEQHYLDVYLNSATAPLPDGEHVLPAASRSLVDYELSDDDVIMDASDAPLNLRKLEVSNRSLKKSEGHVIAGFLPKRGDFDVEFNDGAEAVLADLEIADQDSPEEVELKMRLIEIYNARLDDRERKKQFLFDRGLLDFVRMQRNAHRGSKDERELIQRLRAWAKLQTAREQDEAEKALLKEWKITKELCKVKTWMASGVTSKAEGEMVENTSKEKTARRRKSSSSQDIACLSPLQVLHVEDLPGVDRLSFVERELCSALRLAPASFLALKEVTLESVTQDLATEDSSDVKIVRFDPSNPHTPPRISLMSRRDAEGIGYRNIPRLRARRRAGSRRTEKLIFDKWIKQYGQTQRVRLRRSVRVDRWGVSPSGDEREENEDFFDEPWFVPGLMYDVSSGRECSETYFDKVRPENPRSPAVPLSTNMRSADAERKLAEGVPAVSLPRKTGSSESPHNGFLDPFSEKTTKHDKIGRTNKAYHPVLLNNLPSNPLRTKTTRETSSHPSASAPMNASSTVKSDLGLLHKGGEKLRINGYHEHHSDLESKSSSCVPGKHQQYKQEEKKQRPSGHVAASTGMLVPMSKDPVVSTSARRACDNASLSGVADVKQVKQSPTLPTTPVSTETQDPARDTPCIDGPCNVGVIEVKKPRRSPRRSRKRRRRNKGIMYLTSPARSLRSSDKRNSLRGRRS